MTKNILLVGVGGQGTITASKLLTLGLIQAGYDVKMSEIHGMSQRGGSVVSHIRYSTNQVFSPVIEKGCADLVVAFEKMEAARYIDYLAPDGKLIVNDYAISSIPISIGAARYPEGINDYLSEVADTLFVNADGEAKKLGNSKVGNVVLLGVTVKKMNLTQIDWERIIEDNVKKQYIEVNKLAFSKGIDLA